MKNFRNESGQAMIALLFFVIMATVYTSAAIVIVAVNSLSATKNQAGTIAAHLAESATENAMIQLLRDPNYVGGTFDLDDGSATVVVSGGDTKMISVTATAGDFVRKTQLTVDYSTGALIVTSWKEVF